VRVPHKHKLAKIFKEFNLQKIEARTVIWLNKFELKEILHASTTQVRQSGFQFKKQEPRKEA
jgi:hypothetical protein